MTLSTNGPPVVLIAGPLRPSLTGLLESANYAVLQAPTGQLALDWVHDFQPDVVLLEASLPDMRGWDVCRALHDDLRIGHNVPILILIPGQPTPEHRVAALSAGAWDLLSVPEDAAAVSLKLQTYLQAKRNIDVALAGGWSDPTTGLYSRPALAHRAREVGALMARQHGALACVVFALDADPLDSRTGMLLARHARRADVVGTLSGTELAVVAPATDDTGAVKLAQRIAGVVRQDGSDAPILAGYDAVANLTYSPIDPVELLARASIAVHQGKPDVLHQWVRRFETGISKRVSGGLVPFEEEGTP
jgi:PleD family two-component response regulator